MYYHELVTQIANAIRNGDEEELFTIESKTRDLLLSDDEMNAIMNLVEAAFLAVEAINHYV